MSAENSQANSPDSGKKPAEQDLRDEVARLQAENRKLKQRLEDLHTPGVMPGERLTRNQLAARLGIGQTNSYALQRWLHKENKGFHLGESTFASIEVWEEAVQHIAEHGSKSV